MAKHSAEIQHQSMLAKTIAGYAASDYEGIDEEAAAIIVRTIARTLCELNLNDQELVKLIRALARS